jgi:N-acetylglucosaminyldiphosphoundecaprenol N-acetyl-beta-D-mannosaminyltransferase
MEKLIFEKNGLEKVSEILDNNQEGILNFLNANSVYLFRKNNLFRKSVLSENVFNFPDGMSLRFIEFLKFKFPKRSIGPVVTKNILNGEGFRFVKSKKHFFIDGDNENCEKIIKTCLNLEKKNCSYYNPPYISKDVFPENEIKKIIQKIKKFNPDYIWLGIGQPKMEILSNKIFSEFKNKIFFNIGAALDYLGGKKKESPNWIRKIGLEWFYRLITDFKYTKKKVYQSFLGFLYSFKSVGYK